MGKDRKPRLFVTLTLIFTILISVSGTVSANSIQRPTFYVEFINAQDARTYYTILLYKKNDGRQPLFEGTAENHCDEFVVKNLEEDGVFDVLENDVDLEGYDYDKDGSTILACKANTYSGYYGLYRHTDYTFKFMLYWPDTGEYKFTEEFSINDYNKMQIDLSEEAPYHIKNMDYDYDINTILKAIPFHLVITLVIELLFALLFKIATKRNILTILATNVITNVSANLVAILSCMHYFKWYVLIEVIIVIVEFLVYRKLFERHLKTGKIFLYTAAANAFSAFGGFLAFLAVITYF